jgi:hypothetical protein
MAIADTMKFEEMVLEVEFTPDSGTFAKVCGLSDVTVSRTSATETTMIPDCADESLPHTPIREVVSKEIAISGTGVWALAVHAGMYDWWASGSARKVRITNAKVTADGAAGDPEVEEVEMLLTSLSNQRTKGQRVTAEIELAQNGALTVTEKSA